MSEGRVSDANDNESRKPGRTRDLSARQSVRIIDKLATNVITIGGLFVILAVLGIMAFLVAVALPLFAGETITGSGVFRVAAPKSPLLSVEVDDYKTIAVLVSKDGVLTPVHASTGKTLRPLKLDFGGTPASAFGRTLKGGNVAFGFPMERSGSEKSFSAHRCCPLKGFRRDSPESTSVISPTAKSFIRKYPVSRCGKSGWNQKSRNRRRWRRKGRPS